MATDSSYPFVFLIAHPRSGSHALCSSIAENGNCFHLGEVFNANGDEHRENYFHFLKILQATPLASPKFAQSRFYTYLRYLQAIGDGRRMLIDMKYDTLHTFEGTVKEIHQPPKVISLLRQSTVPVVHLTRNLLHMYVSMLNAVATRQWHVAPGEQTKIAQIVVPLDGLMAFLHQKSFEVAEVRRYLAGLDCAIEVTYEQFFRDEDHSERQRLFDFLGIEDQGRPPLYEKQISQQYEKMIQNYGEVVAMIKSSQFAYVLAD